MYILKEFRFNQQALQKVLGNTHAYVDHAYSNLVDFAGMLRRMVINYMSAVKKGFLCKNNYYRDMEVAFSTVFSELDRVQNAVDKIGKGLVKVDNAVYNGAL